MQILIKSQAEAETTKEMILDQAEKAVVHPKEMKEVIMLKKDIQGSL